MEIGTLAELVLGVSAAGYAAALLRMYAGLGRLRVHESQEFPSATVLVAARNEEDTIGPCLESLTRQDYPGSFDILVLNDSSSDRTAAVVRDAMTRNPRVRLLEVTPATDGTAAKKHALAAGVAATDGDLVFVTDADCVVPPGWMRSLAGCFSEEVGLVTGAVFLPPGTGLMVAMRNLDFAAYSFCSAGAMASGWPLLATAMNLAYRRVAFQEAGGFGGHAHVTSGDDDLLLHGIVSRTRWKPAFAFGAGTVVTTAPVDSLGSFLNQRMRWASKAFRYPPGMMLFLIAAFLLYAGLLVGLPLVFTGLWGSVVPLAAAATKLLVDGLVIVRGCRLFEKRDLLWAFAPAELLHLPYILVASLGGALGLFRWKGRKSP
jgi:cellulose synthase/poly-beta-1,6-N-acetylglucosamine synthase-like glycosyltransferase